ncbi:uncharacterized protein LOC143226618 [Tachypleus tridentatus]|uniref:uncharacterized protein LOC143226618 n=1 Tax=Tachypleus tridentatus TaxID=6853 RepID=UPI003FD5AA76
MVDELLEENLMRNRKKRDGKREYAFDNPHFRDDENDGTTPDTAEKGKATVIPDHPIAPSGRHTKVALPPKQKKNRLILTKPFTSVFHPHKKHRTMDDNDLSTEPEIVLVPLRGHDFTGLGFNILGNMRDGIFVKDVLHRGPASESGRIKAGDRILSVTVSFTNMVYEDALTILSYASPYDVQLELEKTSENDQGLAPPPIVKRQGSSSFSNEGQRLFHPLYRSQSIDDLTQIDKDSFPSQGIIPKRSQSIGLETQRLRSHLDDRSKDVVPEEIDRLVTDVTGSMNECMLATATVDDGNSKKLSYQERNVDFPLIINEKSLTHVKYETEELGNSENFTNTSQEKQSLSINVPREESCPRSDENFVIKENEQNTKVSDMNEEKALSLPRKTATPGKRRAPAPPQSFHGVAMETKALVHQFEDMEENIIRCNNDDKKCSLLTESTEDRKNSIESSKPQTSGISDSVEVDSLENFYMYEETYVGEEEDSDVSKDSLEIDDKGEKVRRRSSSLGDIKKLEEAVNRSPTLLERAVSLDFQKLTLPEGNLREQNKILGPTNYNPQEEEVFISLKEVKEPIKHLNISKISPHEVEAKPQKEINNSFALYDNENISGTNEMVKNHSIKQDASLNLNYLSNTSIISKSSFRSNVSSESDHGQNNMTSTPAKRVIKVDNNIPKPDLSFDANNSKEACIPTQKENRPDFTFKNSNYPSPAVRKDNSPLTVDIPIIPPVIRHQDKMVSSPLLFNTASRPENKDVNEISKQKLDSMFFPHKDSLLEQVATKGTHPSSNPELTTKWPSESTDFDSWSFEVEHESTDKSYMGSLYGNSSEISSKLYKTAVEIPLDNSGNVVEHSRKELPPEMSSYTIRSAEGGRTQTVIISTNNTSTARSPPLQLPPPSY